MIGVAPGTASIVAVARGRADSATVHVSPPFRASVSASGRVTGVARGTADVIATGGGITGRATLTVTAPAANEIVISPASGSVGVGATLALSATVHDKRGAPITGHSVWASTNPSRATISAAGTVTGVAVGSVGIVAAVVTPFGTASDTAAITAVPSGTLAISSVLNGGSAVPAPPRGARSA